MKKIKVAVCGGSGYVGAELLRLLGNHGGVEVTAVTSERSTDKSPWDLHRNLYNYRDLKFEPLDKEALLKKADVFMLALPHAASQEAVDYFFSKGKRVIDLSADFRLRDAAVYEKWYKTPHSYQGTLKKAVYGLAELYRAKIRKTRLVAVPGCYPTSAILGLAPALKAGIVDTKGISVDSKSGTSGAGRKADLAYAFCEVNEGFKAYGVCVHRHTPEIEQELSVAAGADVVLNFTPHLLPVDRGIISTMYAPMKKKMSTPDVLKIYNKAYAGEQFVEVLPEGEYPNILHVRGTNLCRIGLAVNERTGTLIVVSAIDNLIKGAAGQAVQCMNIMSGFDEAEALSKVAICP